MDYLPHKSVGGILFGVIGVLTLLAIPIRVITVASIAPDRRHTSRGDGESDSPKIPTRSSSVLRADEQRCRSGRVFPGSRTQVAGL